LKIAVGDNGGGGGVGPFVITLGFSVVSQRNGITY